MLRRMLLGILVLGLTGTGAELVFLQHYEDPWQVVPLALIGVALLVVVWHGATRGTGSVRALQAVMALCIFSGLVGIGLHQSANAEFEREMDPSLSGFSLFRESLSGATPALAPGTMVQLGLLGLVYTYRHPRWGPGSTSDGGHAADSRREKWDE